MNRIGLIKRFLKLFILLNMVGFCLFKYGINSSSYSFYDSFKNYGVTSDRRREQKGFVFRMKFNKNYRTENIANFVDFVVRDIKRLAENELDGREDVNKLFIRYRVFDDDGKYLVKFYVYPSKDDFYDVKKFVKKKLLGKSFSDLFKDYDSKNKFKDTVYEYVEKFKKNVVGFLKNLESLYDEERYEKMYNILKDISQSYSRSDVMLSSLFQNTKFKSIIYSMKQILKDLNGNKYRYKIKYIFSRYYDGDYYDDDDCYSSEEYLKDKDKDYINSRWNEMIKKLKKYMMQLFKFCEYNIRELEDLDYSSYRKTLKSLNFGDSVGIVRMEVEKIDRYLEKVKEY